MRRLLIQTLIPLILCLVPFLAGFLVALATPSQALHFYLERIPESRLDWLILGLGGIMFLSQMALSWKAMRWQGTNFDESVDRWISTLAQTAEWFPLLGLFGTVVSILGTFSQVGADQYTAPQQIIRMYAPAMTTTASGLFMALLNILPSWLVLLGRDLVLTLGSHRDSTSGEMRP